MKNINPMRFIGLTSLLPFLMPQEDEQKNLDAVAASRAGDVNPFDQPAVEQGKLLTKKYLR